MKRATISFVAVFLACAFGGRLFAQQPPEGETARVSYLAAAVDVDRTPDNGLEDFEPAAIDMSVPAGSIVRTGRGALCELAMPDGSVLRIASGSVFKVDALEKKEGGARHQKFSLIFGKVKAKAQKIAVQDSKFEIRSGTVLAGVRGTVFGVGYDGTSSRVLVFEGSVDVASADARFESLVVKTGKMGEVAAEGDPERVKRIPKDLRAEWDREFADFGEDFAAAPQGEELESAAGGAQEDHLSLGGYVGTVAFDGDVFAHLVFTPELRYGKFGMGFYIPLIFAPDELQNADEWDFTDLGDAYHDLLIKFSYVSWGALGDPVYANAGWIDRFSLGHGFIVDDYSNTTSFPEELKVGLQFVADGGIVGFESFVGDLSNFELIGGRFYVRPLGKSFPLGFGLTGVHDRPKSDPASWAAMGTTDDSQLPRIFNFGIDAEIPLLEKEKIELKLYADAAKTAYSYPELPSTPPASGLSAGSIDFLEGLGTGFGLMGRAAGVFSWKAEYRYILNYYEPASVDTGWEDARLSYPVELYDLIAYQNGPSFQESDAAGYLLKGGVVVLKKLAFDVGFEGYSVETGTGRDQVSKGTFSIGLSEGLVPGVSARFRYDRTDDLENVFDDFIDENTYLDAVLSYALGPNVSVLGRYNRSPTVDSYGFATTLTF